MWARRTSAVIVRAAARSGAGRKMADTGGAALRARAREAGARGVAGGAVAAVPAVPVAVAAAAPAAIRKMMASLNGPPSLDAIVPATARAVTQDTCPPPPPLVPI